MLPRDAFAAVVRDTPLISIDLVVQDEAGQILLGLRRNRPAQNFWFVPGGRIRKDETLDGAFARLVREELGIDRVRSQARFLGAYEHLYEDNALGEPGFGTHYVVLACVLDVKRAEITFPPEQHSEYRWVSPDEMKSDMTIHANSRAYFDRSVAEGWR